MSTAFTDLVGCTLPIQLAGLGGPIANPELAAAVSNAGALGMLALGGASAPMATSLLDDLDALTEAPFGVNFLMPFVDSEAVVLAGSRARVVEFFYGEPDASLVDLAHAGGALVSWQVGSLSEATAAAHVGCDLVVAQGVEAGGHVRGTMPLAVLLSEVTSAIDVPVVAAGGITVAADVARALASGASAVRVGTRFLAAAEANAHPDYVAAVLAAHSGEDTVLTEAFSFGWPNAPHRVLRTCVTEAETLEEGAAAGEVEDVPGARVSVARFAASPPTRQTTGRIGAMALYAGMGVGGVTCVQPAADIVAELAGGA